jgi:arsenate reductase
MAEALLNHDYGKRFEAQSAGTHPTRVNPYAIAVMDEIGIDISNHRSKSIEEFKNQIFDIVVTVCDRAKESCPFFPGGIRVIHKGFEDPVRHEGPHSEITEAFRNARNEIGRWIREDFIKMANGNSFDIKVSTNGS